MEAHHGHDELNLYGMPSDFRCKSVGENEGYGIDHVNSPAAGA